MQIRDDLSLQWSKTISTPVEKRDKNKYCRFHQDHGHRTNKCGHLKDQVETLIRQGNYRSVSGRRSPTDTNERMIRTELRE